MFDFTNYTYSGLLSLVSAVFGISYPLILDNITRIDEKYGSTLLTKYFLKEKRYKVFRGLLVINLIMAVSIPFALSAFEDPHALLVSQTAGIILLIFASLVLYELILLYQQPGKLLGWLSGKPKGPDYPILEIVDLCIYLSKLENDDYFWQAWDVIGSYVSSRLQETSESEEYPNDVRRIFLRFRGVVGRDEEQSKSSRFRTINRITPLLYPSYSELKPKDGSHQILWTLINDAVVSDNTAWIVQHWSWMDQYYRNKLKYLRYDQKKEKEHREFVLITHIMIGGLLVFHRRYNTINEILFYSNVIPPEYHLLPNSLSEINQIIIDIDSRQSHFMLLEGYFQFANLNHGAQNDSSIYYYAMQFLSLCVIRLWSLTPIKENDKPLETPTIKNSFNKIERDIQIVNMLKRCVAEWYRKDVFSKIERLVFVNMQVVDAKLDEWLKLLSDARDDRKAHPHADRDLIDEFKKELQSASDNNWRKLPTIEETAYPEGTVTDTTAFIEYINEIIDVKLFDNGFNICYTNMPDAYVSYMSRPTIHRYLSLLSNPSKIFKIQYKDIFKALDKLEINADHYLLNAGVYLGNYEAIHGNVDGLDLDLESIQYKDISIHDIDSQMMSIFIIPRYCLPYVEYIKMPESSNLTPLTEEATICSNIDEILSDNFNSSQFVLYLARGIRITQPTNNFIYIRLDITHNTSEGSLDIESVSW